MKSKALSALLAALMLALPSLAGANAIGLPQTGQTTSYASWDDGDIEAGVAWPDPRFTDNGDGTMTDNLTGLMWLKNANPARSTMDPNNGNASYGTCYVVPLACSGIVNWQKALDFITGVNNGTYDLASYVHEDFRVDYTADYTDWRLPNIAELNSLLNASATSLPDWLIAQGFENVTTVDPYAYWSSTTDTQNKDDAWIFDLDTSNGGNSITIAPKSLTAALIWPVRRGHKGAADPAHPANVPKTGQTTCYDTSGNLRDCTGTGEDGEYQYGISWPAPRFTDNGDGTITDSLTGLMWIKDWNCLGGGSSDQWGDSLGVISNLNTSPGSFSCSEYSAAYTDWRMPNRTELISLQDWSRPVTDRSLPAGHLFVDVINNWYWSSTTYAADTTRVWSVNIRYGNVPQSSKDNKQYITAVRGTSNTPVPPPIGDVNGDDEVTVDDAIACLQMLIGVDPGVTLDMALADTDADGKITLKDVLYILKDLAGLAHPFTKEEMAQYQEIEDLLNLASQAMVDNQGGWEDLANLAEVVTSLGLDDVSGTTLLAVADSLRGVLDEAGSCGTYERDLQTKTCTFTFTGGCNGISGVLVITPTYSAETGVVFQMDAQNLQTTDCTLNGKASLKVTASGSDIIVKVEVDDLTACGTALNGTITITCNATTLTVESVHLENVVVSYTVEGVPVTVTATDLIYDKDTGTNGTMTIVYGDATYTLTLTNLVIDQTCGIPTSGTIEVNGLTFDFSQTTCENPSVTVLVMGFPVTMSLEDAMAYFDSL